jgi:hypothetical protein
VRTRKTRTIWTCALRNPIVLHGRFGVREYHLSYVTHDAYSCIVRRSVLSGKINGTYRKSRPLYYTHTQFPRYYICNFGCTYMCIGASRAPWAARARTRARAPPPPPPLFFIWPRSSSRAQDPPLYCHVGCIQLELLT